ncbi:hypothetical protein J6590_084247 [Homalodisca vitripennis]|nr:hypothetical protein J6590_084247 [Homalodisca vitripennis]
MLVQFHEITYCIAKRFRLLNARIRQEVIIHSYRQSMRHHNLPNINHRQDTRSIAKIKSFMSSYQMLRDATYKSNAFYSDTLTSIIFCRFVYVTTSLFLLFLFIVWGSLLLLIITVTWPLCSICYMLLIVSSSSDVTKAADETAPIICKLINRRLDSVLKRRLESFLLQLNTQNVEFSGRGFSLINRQILTTIASAVTTNLSITSKQVKLKCRDCEKEFHGSCLRMSKADIVCISVDGLVWRCQACAQTRRKSMRFDSEITEGKLTLEGVMKNCQRETASLEKCLRMIDELAAENRNLREKVSSLEMRIADLGRRPGPNSPQPGIVVKFVRRLDKEELLRKRIVKSKFFTRHMNFSMDQPVYINEALYEGSRKKELQVSLGSMSKMFSREESVGASVSGDLPGGLGYV